MNHAELAGQTQANMYSQASEPKTTEFDALDNRLRAVMERIGKLGADISSLGDRLYGARPEPVGNSAGPPQSNCATAQIAARLDSIERILTDAERSFERLNDLA